MEEALQTLDAFLKGWAETPNGNKRAFHRLKSRLAV